MWILVKAVVSTICHKHRTEYARSQKETETLWMPEWMHIQAFEKWTIKLHLLSDKKSYLSISVCYFVTHYSNTVVIVGVGSLFPANMIHYEPHGSKDLPADLRYRTAVFSEVWVSPVLCKSASQFVVQAGKVWDCVSTYPANKDSVCVWCLCVCMCLREIEGRVL